MDKLICLFWPQCNGDEPSLFCLPFTATDQQTCSRIYGSRSQPYSKSQPHRLPIPYATQPSGRRHPRSSSCKSGSQPQSSSSIPPATTLALISSDSIIGPFTHTVAMSHTLSIPPDTSLLDPLFPSHEPVYSPPEGAGITAEKGTCGGKAIVSYDSYPPMALLLADLKK